MAEVVAGLGVSHAPSIAHVYDRGKTDEPAWQPLFTALDHAGQWLLELDLDALICIYNDHIDQYFLDAWPTFAIGTGERFPIADEGWTPRPFPPVPGHPALAEHLAASLMGAGVDVTVAREQVVDHGILSPLPLIDRNWAIPIVPLAVNVVWHPLPSPARCWQLGEAIGAAVASFGGAARIAVVGTGGLSHQLTGPNFGEVKPDWDREFLRLIDEDPEQLTKYSMTDFATRGGDHSIEVVQWMAMRAALPRNYRAAFTYYYPYQIMGYAVAGFCPPAVSGAGTT